MPDDREPKKAGISEIRRLLLPLLAAVTVAAGSWAGAGETTYGITSNGTVLWIRDRGTEAEDAIRRLAAENPGLTTLSIARHPFSHAIPEILQAHPNFKTIQFLDMPSPTRLQWDMLGQCADLEKIEMTRIADLRVADMAGLKVKEIVFYSMPPISADDLEALAGMPTVESLSFQHTKTPDPDGLARLARSESLRKLHFRLTRSLTTQKHMAALALCEKLIEIRISEYNRYDDDDLLPLARLPALEVLSVVCAGGATDASKASDETAVAFGAAGNAREFNLPYVNITDRGVASVAASGKLALFITNASEEGISDAGMTALAENPGLRIVEFGGAGVTDTGLAALGAGCPELLRLEIWGAQEITDAGIEALGNCPDLEYLLLRSATRIGDEGLLALSACRGLKEIDLGAKNITDEGFAALGQSPKLEVLKFNFSTDIGDAGVFALEPCLRMRKIHLAAAAGITDASFEVLGQFTELQVLELSAARDVTDLGVAELSGCKSLVWLDLQEASAITDTGLSVFAEHSRLTSLNLSKAKGITDKGLEALRNCRSLFRLHLGAAAGVTDKGIAHLGRQPGLNRLDLSSARSITDAALVSLELGPMLWELHLNSAEGITDAGLERLRGCRNLHMLNLASAKGVTDAGLAILADLPNLRTLDLSSAEELTPEAIQEFRRKKPQADLRVPQQADPPPLPREPVDIF